MVLKVFEYVAQQHFSNISNAETMKQSHQRELICLPSYLLLRRTAGQCTNQLFWPAGRVKQVTSFGNAVTVRA